MPLIFDKYSINTINGPYQMNVLIQNLDIPINNTIILFGEAHTIKNYRPCSDPQCSEILTDYINKLKRIQIDVLGEIIWGEDRKPFSKRYVDLVMNGINKLSLSQKAQLFLMVDFFQVPFLHLLPPILGAELFSDFVERGCRGFQPDSMEEQEVRICVAYIELLGDLL